MKGQAWFKHASPFHHRTLYLCLVALVGVSLLSGAARKSTGRRRGTRTIAAQTIQLPAADRDSALSFEAALIRQQEGRELPSDRPLKPSEVGQLAWAAQGVTVGQNEPGTPPAQLPAPMKLYVTLSNGVYQYDPMKHALKQTSDTDVRAALASAALDPTGTTMGGLTGGCQIILAGSSRDFSARYGNKARNAMLMLAGQMVQNIELQALSLGLTYVPIDNASSVSVRRVLRLSRSTEPLYVLLVGYPASQPPEQSAAAESAAPTGAARAVIIAPQRDFVDAELFETKRQLELASVQVLVAGLRAGRMVGSFGTAGQADLSISQVKVEDFDAFIFIGGAGSIRYINNSVALNLARQVAVQRKVLAASGNAPTILARAGVLNGARVTALLTERELIMAAGALYTGNPVEKDGPLVTSTGAMAIPTFVTGIVDALNEQ